MPMNPDATAPQLDPFGFHAGHSGQSTPARCALRYGISVVAAVALVISGCTTSAPGDPDTSLRIAREHLASYRPQSALRALSAARAATPRDAETEILAAEAFYLAGDYTAAAAHYRSALTIAPERLDAAIRLWAARLQGSRGDATQRGRIRAEIDRLARRTDTRSLLLAYWGYYYLWDASARQAVLRRIVDEAPDPRDRPPIAEALRTEIEETRSLARAGRFATTLLDDYTGADPDPHALAVVFSAARRDGATATRNAARKYRERFRNDPFANYYAAAALPDHGNDLPHALGAAREAAALFERRLEKTNSTPPMARYYRHWYSRALTVLGQLLYADGDLEGAQANLHRATRENPADGRALYYRARIAMDRGDNEGAIVLLAGALNQVGAPGDTRDLLATLLRQQHRYSGDARDFIAAIQRVPRFDDITAAAGLAGVRGTHAAFADIDNDGDDDLLIDGRRLFRNTGTGNYRETRGAIAMAPGFAPRGGVFADTDRDGDVDLLVWGEQSVTLLENDGKGMFRDASQERLPALAALRPEALAFGDLDNDGYPDLYIANYQRPGVERAVCERDRVLRNLAGKQFVEAGPDDFSTETGLCGRGVVWSDLDGDGRQEILVANYRLQPNLLWRRDAGGRWRDTAAASGFAGIDAPESFGHSIGVATGDIDADGDIDVFVANLAHPRALHYSEPGALYRGGTARGVTGAVPFQETDADTVLFDADNDGDLDLLITATYRGHASRLFLNDGAGRLVAAGWSAGVDVQNAWGVAVADIDRDGDVDVLVASEDGIRLLRNRGNGNRGLTVRLRDRHCHTNGLGARMRLVAGTTTAVREIQAGRGTGSQDSSAIHLGLGAWRGAVTMHARDLCGNTHEKTISTTAKTVTVDLD